MTKRKRKTRKKAKKRKIKKDGKLSRAGSRNTLPLSPRAFTKEDLIPPSSAPAFNLNFSSISPNLSRSSPSSPSSGPSSPSSSPAASSPPPTTNKVTSTTSSTSPTAITPSLSLTPLSRGSNSNPSIPRDSPSTFGSPCPSPSSASLAKRQHSLPSRRAIYCLRFEDTPIPRLLQSSHFPP
eukprot:TRINITY_DN2163_c0_g3_i1.p1 TRINITY_DN2163_c0_g3~~TRINITY_DN2163_c0_g3_i1.p1  ORF type:complete len:181 (-),score=51.29 TRINITY_DN2163_c0_g3_i1:521-1063(-)